MKKSVIKLFLINLALLIGGKYLLQLLAVTVFATIFNAIFGNPQTGIYATNVFIRICLPFVNVLAMCIPHARNEEAHRAFLKELQAEKYDRKADFKALAKTKEFRNECVIFTILYVYIFIVSMSPKWIFLVAILIFPFINLWHHTAVRKQWASERLHLAPKSEDDE
jgi:hypothetical protein